MSVLACAAVAASLVLVRDGRPSATIVLDERPTQAAQLGAFELQHVVRKITGATLPIGSASDAVAGAVVHIGEGKGFRREEYAVRFGESRVDLLGHDDAAFGKVNYADARTFPRPHASLHSSLFAVYDFLEKGCGVRFYMPGDIGIACVQRKTLVAEMDDVRREPSMKAIRYSTMMKSPLTGVETATPRDRHLLQLRWRMAMNYGMSNHNILRLYAEYWDKSTANPAAAKLFKGKKRDIFAKGYAGRGEGGLRFLFPEDPDVPPQLCYSNPETIRLLADQARRQAPGERMLFTAFADYPKLPDFPYSYPMLGGDNGSYCLCERCRGAVPESARTENEKRTWLYFNFINALCRELKKSGEGYSVAAGVYSCVPQDVLLEDNMSLQFMYSVSCWQFPHVRRRYVELFDFWSKKAGDRAKTVWAYLIGPWWDMQRVPRPPMKCFPGFYPHQTADVVRHFASRGVTGWFQEAYVDFCFLEAFMAMNLCYDDAFDVDGEYDLFFRNFFGAAAEPMRAYWDEVERAFTDFSNYPESAKNLYHGVVGIGMFPDEVNWALGTPERVAKLDGLFRDAESRADGEAVKQRLAYLRRLIHGQMVEGRREFEARQAKRESLAKMPVRTAYVPLCPPAGGDAARVDFSKAGRNWIARDVNGSNTTSGATLWLAHDAEFLYFKYDEPRFRASEANLDIWSENIEMFFGASNDYPYGHLVVSPKGKSACYRHSLVNGIVGFSPCDMGLKCASATKDGRWIATGSIPLSKLLPDKPEPGYGTASRFRMNVFRSSPGRTTLCWSPIYTARFLDGIYRMGEVELARPKDK